MKAVQIVKPNDLRIIDMDKPTIDVKNNVLVKIKAAGICGSDVGIYHGTNAAATYPRVIGHEIVGVVEEVGDNAKKIKVGDMVRVMPMGGVTAEVMSLPREGGRPRHHRSGHRLRPLLRLPQGPSQCL